MNTLANYHLVCLMNEHAGKFKTGKSC